MLDPVDRASTGLTFAFKEPDSWPEPAQRSEFDHEQFGRVEILSWTQLHAREDADRSFAVLRIQTYLERVQTYLERARLPAPDWPGWQGPEDYPAGRLRRFLSPVAQPGTVDPLAYPTFVLDHP
jgi:hypothetical protein